MPVPCGSFRAFNQQMVSERFPPTTGFLNLVPLGSGSSVLQEVVLSNVELFPGFCSMTHKTSPDIAKCPLVDKAALSLQTVICAGFHITVR
jgi:hypothetical protein